MDTLIAFKAQDGKAPPMEAWPELDSIVSGTPRQSAFTAYTSPDGGFITGIWSCTPGKFHVTYTGSETIFILSGRVTITKDGEAPRTFGPNDVIVVPVGWAGTWEVLEPLRKIFAIGTPR
jgi:uncharacterized cupin superfamily protein